MGEALFFRLIRTQEWHKKQIATLYEVYLPDGRIKYNLRVRDEGRDKPFIDQIFTRLDQLEDFLDNKLRGGTDQEHQATP